VGIRTGPIYKPLAKLIPHQIINENSNEKISLKRSFQLNFPFLKVTIQEILKANSSKDLKQIWEITFH
jgi:hypothetical protein